MRFLTADVVFPVSIPPVKGGILAVEDNGTIKDIIHPSRLDYEIPDLEKYTGILCPGFVNSHCHLELSWVKGKIEPGQGLDHFLTSLNTFRQQTDEAGELSAIGFEGKAMFQKGIVAVGDISNSLVTSGFKEKSPLMFHTFCEVFASNPASAETAFNRIKTLRDHFRALKRNNSASVAPHSAYSVSQELFRMIAAEAAHEGSILSIHHLESEEEILFFKEGTSSIVERRQRYNPGIAPFSPTGKSPVESIGPYFLRSQPMLLVHNTLCEESDIDAAQSLFDDVSWCLCPGANLFIEKRLPPVDLFLKKGCKITLGTDSLASNTNLSILEEMRILMAHFPELSLETVMPWATSNGAEALGFHQLGSFERGMKPGVVLIENSDNMHFALTTESTSRLIIEHGYESIC